MVASRTGGRGSSLGLHCGPVVNLLRPLRAVSFPLLSKGKDATLDGVDRVGFEPTASALRRRRSSADLSARGVVHIGARHIDFVGSIGLYLGVTRAVDRGPRP